MFDTNGNLLEENRKDTPQSIVLGKKQVFEPIEKAMSASPLDSETEIFVPFSLAYGPYDMSLVFEVSKEKFKKPPNIGDIFKVRTPNGVIERMTVIDFKKEIYIIDGNHPLAGIDLVFKIEILDRHQVMSQKFKLGKINPI